MLRVEFKPLILTFMKMAMEIERSDQKQTNYSSLWRPSKHMN